MRVMVAGGGTGGHLFPGLAIAQALVAAKDAEVCFVGSHFGIEARVIPKTSFPFVGLPISGLRGRGLRGAVTFAWQLPLAFAHAWRAIGNFRPNLVLGLGGYGSVPVVVAAWLRGVASVLLEQNAHPGMANRVLARLARRVCTTFADSAGFFPPGKAVFTGNPVRSLPAAGKPSADHFTLFVFGGSQGARSINRAVVEAAPVLAKEIPGLRILHQTGLGDAEWVTAKYHDMSVAAEVLPFIHDMGEAYGRADLVVCRAGATTIAELTILGKPAILIPYPYAADDHQRANAEVLVRHDAAQMILDRDLTGDRLAAAVRNLVEHRARLTSMAEAARALGVPDAAEKVIAVCQQIIAEVP